VYAPPTPEEETRALAAFQRALRQDPGQLDALLSAHGRAPADVDALVYRIARDPLLSERYAGLLRGESP
jgi:hypothetical protein